MEALYRSDELETALVAYKQGSSLPRPATLATYAPDLGDMDDLSAGYDADRWASQ